MKLYLAPAACSLADHIAMTEAGLAFEIETVDIPTRRTGTGEDFTAINPKGYVPALILDDGALVTENAAILTYVAERQPGLSPDGPLGRVRLAEALSFVAAEIHKPFIRLMFPAGEEDARVARAILDRRFAALARDIRGPYWLGERFTVADAYLYVMLRWAVMLSLPVPDPFPAYRDRVEARPAVQAALRREGLA